MISDTQRKQQILRRIDRMSKEKLIELDKYLSGLEKVSSNKARTLSFAGAWEDIDDSVYKDLTDNLISNRKKNRNRMDG